MVGLGSYRSFKWCGIFCYCLVGLVWILIKDSLVIGSLVIYGLVRKEVLVLLDFFFEIFGFGKLRY